MTCGGDFICAKSGEVSIAALRYGTGKEQLIDGSAMLLAGSDKVNEDPGRLGRYYRMESVAAISGLRFALATKQGLVDEVRSRIDNAEPVRIGSEYPRTLARYFGCRPAKEWRGKSEGMIDYYGSDDIQAVFTLVDTGQTLKINELVIVEDDIEPVELLRVEAIAAAERGKANAVRADYQAINAISC